MSDPPSRDGTEQPSAPAPNDPPPDRPTPTTGLHSPPAPPSPPSPSSPSIGRPDTPDTHDPLGTMPTARWEAPAPWVPPTQWASPSPGWATPTAETALSEQTGPPASETAVHADPPAVTSSHESAPRPPAAAGPRHLESAAGPRHLQSAATAVPDGVGGSLLESIVDAGTGWWRALRKQPRRVRFAWVWLGIGLAILVVAGFIYVRPVGELTSTTGTIVDKEMSLGSRDVTIRFELDGGLHDAVYYDGSDCAAFAAVGSSVPIQATLDPFEAVYFPGDDAAAIEREGAVYGVALVGLFFVLPSVTYLLIRRRRLRRQAETDAAG